MKTITLITNTEILGFEETLKLSKKLSRIGLDRIQIRERNVDQNLLRNFIKNMKDSVEERCQIIINGNLDLAIEQNLDGVHFPENYPVTKRAEKENFIFGRSIHESTRTNNLNNYFDYFHLGPVFPTKSHPGRKKLDDKNILNLSHKLSKIILVGGIKRNNVHKLLKHKFYGIAIMRELLLSSSPESTFLELKEKING